MIILAFGVFHRIKLSDGIFFDEDFYTGFEAKRKIASKYRLIGFSAIIQGAK